MGKKVNINRAVRQHFEMNDFFTGGFAVKGKSPALGADSWYNELCRYVTRLTLRFFRPSLHRMFSRCRWTVAGEIDRNCAISLFDSPLRIIVLNAISTGVSCL